MEVGRRFGNQVGDRLKDTPRDIRGHVTGQVFEVRAMQPTGPWAGNILAYVNTKKAGAYSEDPFFVPAPAGRRIWLDFVLAGALNQTEDVVRYLRSLPGDRFEITWRRQGTAQSRFRLYHTVGVTGTPAVLVREFRNADRVPGSGLTSAQFDYVTDVLRTDRGHSYQVRPVDTAGNEKTGCAVLTGILTPWPQPPTGVEIQKYVKTTGLVTVKWSKASGQVPTSTYRLYRNSGNDSRVKYGTAVAVAATAFVLTGTPPKPSATFSLPVTGPLAAGVWIVGVRHTKWGIEEDNFSALARFTILSSGAYSPGLPEAPSLLLGRATASGKVWLDVGHDNLNEPSQTLRFRVYRSPGNSITIMYGTAIGTLSRSPLDARFFAGTFQTPALTHGMVYRFGVRSEATAGLREVNTAFVTAKADALPPVLCPSAPAMSKVIG